MQSTVEVVCVGNGSNRTYNSVYTDPGVCKMVIVQDDDKFPSPRLCLLRRWPNFEGGFGFSLYEDLISSGALKVEEVVRHSPAEAGGLRKNDVIVEINRENIELKSFFPLVEILKEAFGQNDMELLVLAEQDAQWYRLRNITVNNNFPNIEYCETPYYGHILKPLDSFLTQPKLGNSQIEFHSSTGKLFRTTLVIDKERDSVYRRVEELPSNAPQAVDPTIPPLRPDGTFRHPGADNGSVRVYYRRDHTYQLPQTVNGEELNADSGLGSLRNRSTPNNLNNTTMSPFSTLGKSNDIGVDLLHDRWADLMDKYLDDKFRSGSVPRVEKHERPDRDTSVSKKTHIIRLNDPNATISTKSRSKSRCQSPNDASFSYLYSGRDDYQTASATSFKDINRQQSPFQNRGSPQTQSHNRFTSPNHVQSPVKQKYPIQVTGHKSRPQQQVNQPTTSSYQYDSSSYTATTTTYKPSYQQQNYTNEKLRPVQNVEIVSHESHTASVKPINVIYDSVVHEAQSVKETVIKPQVSESTPSNSNVLLQKYEREQKEREQKEREQKEREQKEREQKEREQREKERLEREQREKERLEREQREREERERLERIEFEKKMREQEEYERLERIQREKEMREREEREKAQRDREREQARQEFERQIKEKREREEKEKREELERQDLLKTKSDPETALSALTSIIVTGNQPIKKPLGLQEEITETSTTSEVYKIRQDSREEITHRVSTHELNNEIIETEYTDEYIQQDEQVSYESSSQISDEDEQRRIYAEFERQQEVMEILYKYITHPTIQDKLEKHRIYNQEGYFGYGMSFHQEPVSPSLPSHKLVYPRIELEPDSPSVDAGLKSDQRVVAVNGKLVNVEFNTLDDIAQEIEESYYDAKYTDLTVMSPDLWNRFMENPVYVSEIVSIKPEHVQAVQQVPKPVVEEIVHVTKEIVSKEIPIDDVDPKRPRLIRLVRTPRDEQFGFDFKTIKPDMRYVASSVQPNLPAHRAGLKDHDNILEVNGEFIHGMEHDAVVKKIKSIPDKVDLLVVTDINEYFALVDKAKRDQVKLQQFKPESPISVHDEVNIDLRVPHIKYYKVRTDPNYKGLGISLTPNGIISSIDPESPSDRAGLRKDQRIVEVDRVDVRDKSNTEIARLIKSKDNLEIGVVDVDPSETSADVSPASVRPTKDQTVPEVLISSISSATGQKLKDQLTGARVCHLVRRPDFNGFGFSMRPNESGPHQISGVEENSPAEQSGLRVDDLILKVNDQNIIGDRYSKTTALIKNECEKGRLKLEVIETKLCPPEVRNTPLTPPSGYSTISSSSNKKNKSDSISNLRAITTEMVQQTSPKTRAVSADTGADRSKRPYSMTDLDRIPGNSTIRSITSIGTTATGFSQSNLANISSKSAGNLSTITNELPKFKRCVVQIIPEYKDGYGFTLNSKIKPKYMIFTVDPESPAYAANLRPTDVIVEIDKKNIRRLKFEKVRNMLTESRKRGQVEILAISKEGYLYFKNKKKKFSSTKLVTVDNTELHSTFDGIRTRESSVNNNRVSLEVEGDKRAQSAGIVYSRPSTENLNQQRPHSVSPTPSTQAVELDLDDVIICTIKRREDNPSIGLSLSPGGNRSVSKSTGKSVDTNNLYPVVTSVDAGSPAEEAGLRAGDVVIEINGKSTFGQPNSVIRLWIQEAGQQIEFTVKREKSSDERLMESAKIITNTVVQSAVQKLEASSPSSVHRLSRKDSFSSKTQSPQPSRVATLEESYMSSSKYQDFPSGQAISPRPVRNQSEPAPQDETSKSSTNLQTAESPISRRSLSSYTLPRDAPIPRLCRVRAYEEQLGFTVSGSKTNPGVFKVTEVATNSAAANSGLKNDDYIIEVSGVNVENLDYNELVGFIRKKKQDDDLQLLVADRQTLEWYKQKKIPISSNVVPKMQYIETLLKEELDRELNSTDLDQSGLNTSEQLRSSDKKIKVPFQPGRSVWIHRKIYLCHQPVSTLSYSMNDLSQANNV